MAETHLLSQAFVVMEVQPARRAQQTRAGFVRKPHASPALAVPAQPALGLTSLRQQEDDVLPPVPPASAPSADNSFLALEH